MGRRAKLRLTGLVLVTGFLLACQPSQPVADTSDASTTPAQEQAPAAKLPPASAVDADSMRDPSSALPERDTTPVDTVIDAVTLSAEGDTEQNTLGPPKTHFGPKDSVYAEIRSNGTASAYTIYAKWTGADGEVLADYGIRVNEAGPKRTVISLSKPDGWPAGRNNIELAINGKTLRTVAFDVQ
ncbi:hypothetical protein [Luteimonas mephitis]|jgi:hypothetical protein|uniref:hypothetical protein n=1 Tax=Luteimonas mephitis TaxID=83615 RepID=UPI00146B2EAF|nr:hypothetical protein [Luteimonas mephitis]